ncbi:MAG: rRNA maturation RNase YbeY, partial [Lachnospiraceae bacterium]|nr:rRNA maturation RNase YbeY [Lachnospiraceae bacterium]
MTFCVESETKQTLPFDAEAVAVQVIREALAFEKCPYEVEVAVLLTDSEEIHAMNNEFRGIDRPTDVLSFPNVDYEAPADFTGIEDMAEDYFNPESGELCLG